MLQILDLGKYIGKILFYILYKCIYINVRLDFYLWICVVSCNIYCKMGISWSCSLAERVKSSRKFLLIIPPLTLSQWSSSGNPVAIQCAWNLDPSVHWNATGEMSVCFQWSSSVFQLCKLTLDRHWNTTGCKHQPVWFQWHPSVLVAPVVFQCGLSSGIPVYWHNLVWRSMGQVTSQHATPNVYNCYGESCLS